MKRFGFLSFGHYSLKPDKTGKYGAQEALKQAVELGQIADELGVNGAYFRVHHFAPQYSSPIPLLSAIAATTNTIEVGTGVIDMRYENPLGLAEEVAALDLLSDQRIAIGVSRGSPETALRGWEAFGYGGPELAQEDPKGAALAAEKFDTFLAALRGNGMATAAPFEQQYPQMFRSGAQLPVLPHSPGADRRIWWGAATHASAELAARKGVNLMSSTLVFETDGSSLGDVQAEQIARYRREWEKAGHDWEPRVSVSRPIFPIVDGSDAQILGRPAVANPTTPSGCLTTSGESSAAPWWTRRTRLSKRSRMIRRSWLPTPSCSLFPTRPGLPSTPGFWRTLPSMWRRSWGGSQRRGVNPTPTGGRRQARSG